MTVFKTLSTKYATVNKRTAMRMFPNYSPRNAVGEMTPSLTATMMVMPVSRKGTEKSMT